MTSNETLVISTGMKDLVSKSILDNVLGQLSDGMWENSKTMEHYWPFVEIKMVEDDVCIVIRKPGVSNIQDKWHTNNTYNNWFLRNDKLNCDPIKIKKWFANKIHRIVSENAKDYPNSGIKFSAKCEASLDYMYDYTTSGRDHKVSEAYAVYKSLNAK